MVHYCLCHSDSASVPLSYSFLTVDYCSLCCARLVSQLRFVSVRGTNTLYDEPLFTSYRYCRHSQLHKICLFLKCLLFPWSQCRSIVYTVVCATVIVHHFFWMYLYYVLLHILVELVVQFPVMGSTQVLFCLFPGVLWLWHFLYSVGPHPVSSLRIYSFVMSRAFMASQAGDADSSRAPWCSIVGATVTVHQLFCILHSNLFFSFNLKISTHKAKK